MQEAKAKGRQRWIAKHTEERAAGWKGGRAARGRNGRQDVEQEKQQRQVAGQGMVGFRTKA